MFVLRRLNKINRNIISSNIRCSSEISRTSKINKIDINVNEPTNIKLIEKDYGLREFIKKTYVWSGFTIAGSIGASALASSMFPELIMNNILPIFGSGLLLGLGGAITLNMFKDGYTIYEETFNYKNKQNIIYYSINSNKRLFTYGCLVSGMSIVMMPLCVVFHDAIIPAFIASSSVFGGVTIFAMTRKKGELEPYQGVLYGGLSGLVGVSLLGIGSNLIFGVNYFGETMHIINLYGGIPLFTGLIAYDTHKAIMKYESKDPDHLGCSVELYLDFINLFTRFLEIMSKVQNNK